MMNTITKPQIIAMLSATALAIGVGSYANGQIQKHNDSVKTQISQQKITNMCQALSDHGVMKSYYDRTAKSKKVTLEVPSVCVNILSQNIAQTVSHDELYIQASSLMRKTGIQDLLRPIFFDDYASEIDKWAQSEKTPKALQFILYNMSRDLDRYATYHTIQKDEARMPVVQIDPSMEVYATQIRDKHNADESKNLIQMEKALTKLYALNAVNMLPATLLLENDTEQALRFLKKDPTSASDQKAFETQLNPKVVDIIAALDTQVQQVKTMKAQIQKEGLANTGPLI